MSKPYKPDGYPSASAYFVPCDADAMIAFVEQVFGGERTRRFNHENGKPKHIEVKFDDVVIMIGVPDSDRFEQVSNMLHVYVPDAAATYARAIAHGARSIHPPEQKDDPDLRGGFTDPWGNSWFVATQQDAGS
ncbi:MAG: VOC family protein [Pseudomonadota bacterium]